MTLAKLGLQDDAGGADVAADLEEKVGRGHLATPIPAIAGEPGAKGLKGGALGFVSSVVIGVSSTAPAYSLASSFGLVAVAVGFQSPAIMILTFIPMLFMPVLGVPWHRATA